jgi:aminopeptidase N
MVLFHGNRSYKNAVEDDLWLALQQQVDEDGIILPAKVKDIMDTWTLQMGFPLITVTRNYTTGSASVSQVQSAKFIFCAVPLNPAYPAGSLFASQKCKLD